MTQFDWSGMMELGVPEMDRAHRDLVEELRQVAGCADEEFPRRLCGLTARLEADFGDEETLMEDIGFEGLHAHLEQHARILGGLHHAASRVLAGDIGCGRHAVALLMQWFPLHFSTMDTALAVALELDAAERAAAAGADGTGS